MYFQKFLFKFQNLIWPIVSHQYLGGSFLVRAFNFFRDDLKLRQLSQTANRAANDGWKARKDSLAKKGFFFGADKMEFFFLFASPFFHTVRKEGKSRRRKRRNRRSTFTRQVNRTTDRIFQLLDPAIWWNLGGSNQFKNVSLKLPTSKVSVVCHCIETISI